MTRLQLGCLALVVTGALPITATLRHALAPAPVLSVIDGAALLSERERSTVANYHDRLLADHDIDYRVVTKRVEGEVDRAAHEAFAALGVGDRSGSGRGLLLLIDQGADRVRLEVAAGLESVFTDAFIAYLEQRQMVPFFRETRLADGILATTELIVARAQEAATGAAFDPATVASFSLGGGAGTAARIGTGGDRTWAQDQSPGGPGENARGHRRRYLAAMAARNGRPDLAVYSRESREMLASWAMTPAQMDTVVRTYRSCPGGEIRYSDQGDLAVIRYAASARQCAPWFLRRDGGRWTMDLTATQRFIRFNHRNQWRMPDPGGHAFAFAFADWRFDRHGFPIENR